MNGYVTNIKHITANLFVYLMKCICALPIPIQQFSWHILPKILRPGDVFARQSIRLLFKVMPWHRKGDKPLPEPCLNQWWCQFNAWGETSVEFQSKYEHFLLNNVLKAAAFVKINRDIGFRKTLQECWFLPRLDPGERLTVQTKEYMRSRRYFPEI